MLTRNVRLLLLASLSITLIACSLSSLTGAAPQNSQALSNQNIAATTTSTTEPIQPVEPSPTPLLSTATPTEIPPTATATDLPAPVGPVTVGPEAYPGGVNPLTGLTVPNPENLALPPALVSITNFPPSARPQAGLDSASLVYELYIGEGMTRFLTVFYGLFPGDTPPEGSAGAGQVNALMDAEIGPLRSGRRPYESLRKLLNGFLVMTSADPKVKESLSDYAQFFGSDDDDINSAKVKVSQLNTIAQNSGKQLGSASLGGNLFDPAVPAGGVKGTMLWLPYSYLNQVIWRYDEASGAYHRWQDRADGTNFDLTNDRLTGLPLTYENVIVMFADHTALAKTIFDVDLLYINRMPAMLFRDGQMYRIYWTTKSGEYEKATGKLRPIRFINADGSPVSLKNGQTWVEIVTSNSPVYETMDSTDYYRLANNRIPGSGIWAVNFVPPVYDE
jgi:hypothetical protein